MGWTLGFLTRRLSKPIHQIAIYDNYFIDLLPK